MKAYDALGFFLFGPLMAFLPALLPGSFLPAALDGANTSALWLEFMGMVNTVIGAGIVARTVPAAVARCFAAQVPALPVLGAPQKAAIVRLSALDYPKPLPQVEAGGQLAA